MISQRKCWPLEVWPPADREAWRLAISPSPLFADGGAASHWKPKTKHTVVKAYGRWLAFLSSIGELSLIGNPADRVTKDRALAYWRQLSSEVAPVTTAGLITNLAEAVRVMVPRNDIAWLKAGARRLTARASPSRDKTARTLPLDELLGLGLKLMDKAEDYKGKRGVKCAARYRIGLMIALLCTSGLRRANFTELTLGQSFTKVGDRYQIALEDEETKGKRSHQLLFSQDFTPHIDRYIECWRPILLGDRISDRLWITWLTDDLTEAGFYGELRKVTDRELGIRVSPHSFRDSLATTVALKDPAHVRMLKAILQHRSLETTNRYYNMAGQAETVGKLQDSVLKLRGARKRRAKTRENV